MFMSNWDIKVINAKDIDQYKWSKMLSKTPELIAQFHEHWFLSAIAENWVAFVYGDYLSAFPCVFKKKYGVKIIYQPFFSRSISLLGEHHPELISVMLSQIQSKYDLIMFNSELDIDGFGFKKKPMRHQLLNLDNTYEKIVEGYSTNAKRILKKNIDIVFEEIDETREFLELFRNTIGNNLGYDESNYSCLGKLIDDGLKKGLIKLISLELDGNRQGFACFYFYKNVINYVKGVLTEEGKMNGAMYFMFDHIIKTNAQSDKILDFGGSDIEGVAAFYKKFGANDHEYYYYEKNQLPFLLKKIYGLRQKFSS